ncbi:MAG: oxidoreductase [Firmicutes bacterium]|nr:oxidoreductase [Bacillota bacterium]
MIGELARLLLATRVNPVPAADFEDRRQVAYEQDLDKVAARDLEKALKRRIRTVFGGSMHLRHVDTGSCNACESELAALLNPFYDVQRLGIDFVASPRHADVLVVTGCVTRNLFEALHVTYEATPRPRAVLAIGACALGQGILGKTYAQAGAALSELPIAVTVPGCPPTPHDIIAGLMQVADFLEKEISRRGYGATAIQS